MVVIYTRFNEYSICNSSNSVRYGYTSYLGTCLNKDS